MLSLSNLAWRAALSELLRHLPPSGSTLHLLYVGSAEQAELVRSARPDLALDIYDPSSGAPFQPESEAYDALLVQGTQLHEREVFLRTALSALRLGGRLIALDAAADAPQECAVWQGNVAQRVTLAQMVQTLEQIGYVRVLTERLLEGCAVLSRGERDYTHLSTLERVQHAAERDLTPSGALVPMDALRLAEAVRGDFIFVLARQESNRPSWEKPAESWQALTLVEGERVCLPVFSALPKAVAFMQAAIKVGALSGVNKIGKLDKRTAQSWPIACLLNPIFDDLRQAGRFQREGAPLKLDPRHAITGEE
ncbi:MAG: hypothetical protein SNJ58_02890 [Aggregatilineales bacterium]